MFGGRNSMSRSTFESHNDKAKQWNYFLLAIKWLQIRCTYIAILIYHSLVTFVILWRFLIIIDYNADKFGNSVVFFKSKLLDHKVVKLASALKLCFHNKKAKYGNRFTKFRAWFQSHLMAKRKLFQSFALSLWLWITLL